MKKKENDSLSYIKIYGAREHNLKNIDVIIPKNSLTVITGPSGSGKSSLALDTLYTEGKRRYMESLSAYARQFLGIPKKPAVDKIEGLCPSIAIEQKTVGANPRSTVGTVTEIYDYMRILFARAGTVHCPGCKKEVSAQSPESIAKVALKKFNKQSITIAAPIVNAKKGQFKQVLKDLFEQGYYRFLINDQKYRFRSLEEINELDLKKTHKHTIDVLLDQLEVDNNEVARILDAIETSFSLTKSAVSTVKIISGSTQKIYAADRICIGCVKSVPELEPRLFSFNSPIGACSECAGLGYVLTVSTFWSSKGYDSQDQFTGSADPAKMFTCEGCFGKRLNQQALAITIGDKNIAELVHLNAGELLSFVANISLSEEKSIVAKEVLAEISKRLDFLLKVGLSYLTLDRSARTLSGGEGQRIRLATQIGSGLSGVCYVLDEPSIGLHQRDNERLIETLKKLRDQGNTVVVVEHDSDTMKAADHIIDMGPAAGLLGGKVTAEGSAQDIIKNKNSLTGDYLSGRKLIEVPQKRRKFERHLSMQNVKKNNLKNVSVSIPLEIICGVSGVSGSGKSSLIMQELVQAVQEHFSYKSMPGIKKEKVEGVDAITSIVVIDQKPIGRTPRSNPATYLAIFDKVRLLYSQLPASQERGYAVGRFSFNTMAGRCKECSGNGSITVSMHYLPDVTVVCKSCKGKRYSSEVLQIKYKEKNISDVLEMTALEAVDFFKNHISIHKRLKLLCDVGLSYLKLGQPSTTLSGGEAQRIKLVNELAKRGNNSLYVLDEPTTGLHANDVKQLLRVLNSLVDKGNSMIIIEHNLDVLKTVDWLIDLGPEGGNAGGSIVAVGTPEEVAKNKQSLTGKYLKPLL